LKANQKVSCAVAAILGAHAGAASAATPAGSDTAASDTNGMGINEVIVTAQRREESAQNVPIMITALTSETLTQLNITTFEDYLKFLPNVSAASHGPGQSQIYMRGLATTEDGNQSTGATGSFPNVAVYLDEQSAQLPGRNLDIYAADLERIEVLEGPQGTLFGAGAEAGVIRYITNKPKIDVTEGNVNAGYAYTSHGDRSSNADAMINVPLIANTLAVRAVIYNDSRGGYIDNVPSTFTRKDTDRGIQGYFGGVVPPNSPVINNDKIDIAKKYGADEVINYETSDFAEEAKRLTGGKGVDLILDAVGKPTFEKGLKCLAPFGHLILFGRAGGMPDPLNVAKLMEKSLKVSGFVLPLIYSNREVMRRGLEHSFQLIREGKLTVPIGGSFPLAQAAERHATTRISAGNSRRTCGEPFKTACGTSTEIRASISPRSSIAPRVSPSSAWRTSTPGGSGCGIQENAGIGWSVPPTTHRHSSGLNPYSSARMPLGQTPASWP